MSLNRHNIRRLERTLASQAGVLKLPGIEEEIPLEEGERFGVMLSALKGEEHRLIPYYRRSVAWIHEQAEAAKASGEQSEYLSSSGYPVYPDAVHAIVDANDRYGEDDDNDGSWQPGKEGEGGEA